MPYVWITVSVAIGTILRVYSLPGQILLDDEWHGMNFVLGKGYWEVLTSFNPVDNSSPLLNLWRVFLYRTFGWSEAGLRFPSVAAGIFGIASLSFLIRKIFEDRVAIFFSILLAVSPFCVFYSRLSRGYSLATLFCFGAVLAAYLWLTTAKKRYAVLYVVTGILSVCSHLMSLIAVFTPILVAVGVRLCAAVGFCPRPDSELRASRLSLICVCSTLSLGLFLLLIPVFHQKVQLPWGMGAVTTDTLLSAATLVSGTSNAPLAIVFFMAVFIGQVALFRDRPILGWIFLAVVFGYALTIVISRPKGIGAAIVLLRYMIVIVPMFFMSVAVVADDLVRRLQGRMAGGWLHPWVAPICYIGIASLLLGAGPFRQIYVSPNNFSNHSAYQGSYAPVDWRRSAGGLVYPGFSAAKEDVPMFYFWLSHQADVDAIIEYPFDITDYNNFYYYYQHFHGKRVLGGYTLREDLSFGAQVKAAPTERFSIGMLSVDQILAGRASPPKLRFRNMVQIDTMDAVRNSGADFIVLHKYVQALRILHGLMGNVPVIYHSVKHFQNRFKDDLGPPVFEDSQIVVFRVRT